MLALLPLLLPSLSPLPQDPTLLTPRQGRSDTTPLLSPAGDRLMVGPWLVDLDPGGEVLAYLPGLGGIRCARFSDDGERVLLSSSRGQLALLNAESGERLAECGPIEGRHTWIHSTPDLAWVVRSGSGGIAVLEGETLQVRAELKGYLCRALTQVGGGLRYILERSGSDNVFLWEGEGEPVRLDLPQGLVYREFCLVEGGQTLLISGQEPWSGVPTKECLLRVDLGAGEIEANVSIPHKAYMRGLDEELGVIVLSASRHELLGTTDRTEVRSIEDLEVLAEHEHERVSMLIPGTASLLLGGRSGVTRAVHPVEGTLLWERSSPVSALQINTSLAPWLPDGASPLPWFAPDGRLVGTDLLTGEDRVLWCPPLRPLALGRAPSGALWCAYRDGRVELLGGTDLEVLVTRELGETLAEATSAGTRLLCRTGTGHAVVLELEDLDLLGREACGQGAAISHRGGRVLLMGGGDEESRARLWDPATGQLDPLPVRGVRRAAVAEDGTALVLLEGTGGPWGLRAQLVRGGEVRSVEPPAEHHWPELPILHPEGDWAFLGYRGTPEDNRLFALVLGGPDLDEPRRVEVDDTCIFGGMVRRARLSPDATRLACTTGDALIAMTFDTSTWSRREVLDNKGGNAGATDMAFSQDSSYLALWGGALFIGAVFCGPGEERQVLSGIRPTASHLVPAEEGLPSAWLLGTTLHLGDPGSRTYFQRIAWPESDVVLRSGPEGSEVQGTPGRRARVRLKER